MFWYGTKTGYTTYWKIGLLDKCPGVQCNCNWYKIKGIMKYPLEYIESTHASECVLGEESNKDNNKNYTKWLKN